MASQLGSIITNPEYAELLGITPALKPEQVKAVVIDDAPSTTKHFFGSQNNYRKLCQRKHLSFGRRNKAIR